MGYNAHRRLYDEHFDRQRKLENKRELKERIEEEQAAQLVQISVMKAKKPGIRSKEQFIEDQEKFLYKKYENLKNAIIKEEINENYTFQPEINKKSVKMLQNVNMDPVELAKVRRMQKEAAILEERG